MSSEIEKIHQLLLSNETNAKVALQLLKKQVDLADAVQQEFAPVLTILGKTKISSIVSLLKKVQQDKKLTTKEKLAIIAYPQLAATITTFNLENCRLKELPDHIENFTLLKKLNLFQNKITYFPSNLAKLHELQIIYLDHNHLSSFPLVLTQVLNLTYLSISNNKIASIPLEIGQLSSLKELGLSNNKIKELPNEVTELAQLETLNIDNNKITGLPENIGKLTRLKSLYLTSFDNKISTIPDSFQHLSSLEYLSLSSTVEMANLSIITKCSSLINLQLWLTKERSIFDHIDNLKALQYLCISIRDEANYPLDKLPDKIALLPNLKQLEVYQHSFNKEERERIKTLLPKCKVLI